MTTPELARSPVQLLRDARVGRLATVSRQGAPSIVPVCFVLLGDADPVIASVLDEKPKRVPDQELARVRHIRHNPGVALVADHYEEEWTRLWFVQAHGLARLVSPGNDGHREAIETLRQKYPQYRVMAIEKRPVILIEHLKLKAWIAAEAGS